MQAWKKVEATSDMFSHLHHIAKQVLPSISWIECFHNKESLQLFLSYLDSL